MLVFDRPGFISGVIFLDCPEKRMVDGEEIDVIVRYEFRKKDVGKEFDFPNENYMIKNHAVNFRHTADWTLHHERVKKIKADSVERRRILDVAEGDRNMRKGNK